MKDLASIRKASGYRLMKARLAMRAVACNIKIFSKTSCRLEALHEEARRIISVQLQLPRSKAGCGFFLR